MLDTALEYQKIGLSVIPVGKEKKPFIQWQRYQKERASEDQIKLWWKQWPDANIGIVTGIISGLAVIDIDTEEGKQSIQEYIPDIITFPVAQTPSGGQHYYFRCPDAKLSNNTRVIPGCDLRANGGYIVAPPSRNSKGKGYTWLPGLSIFEVPLIELPASYLSYLNNNAFNIKKNPSKKHNLNENNELQDCELQTVTKQLQKVTDNNSLLQAVTIGEGERDEKIFHLANCLVKGGAHPDFIYKILCNIALTCNPPFHEKEVQAKLESALKRALDRDRNITEDLKNWIELQDGYFSVTDCYNELQAVTKQQKTAVRVALLRSHKDGILEKHSNKSGTYRKIDTQTEEIDFINADLNELDIILPFNLDRYVNIYPKNIIVVAGSPDSGKTAFLLNLARLNLHKHKIHYFSSEMAEQELKLRLSKFEDVTLKDFLKVKWIERASNFSDVIRSDDINIIDYLEVHEDFWKIGGYIRDIYDKLKKGIAVIALQKDRGKEFGLGATRGLEKARLYITMNPGELKIVKAKNWRDPAINPNSMKLNYKLFQGCKFSITKELPI